LGARVSRLGLWGVLLAGCASGAPLHVASPESAELSERAAPPADLDARLLQHYPLRGFVLSESGFEESTWAPARDRDGKAIELSATFDCVFEHPSNAAPRSARSAVAKPPVQPDYGADWFAQITDDRVPRDASAELIIRVGSDGRVQVLGSSPGSHAVVADVCRQAIEAGPPWQPAEDTRGNPVLSEATFPCSVKAMSEESSVKVVTTHKELALGNVGAAGALPVEQLAVELTSRLSAFTHCFESAASLSKPIHGTHWLAFQIQPDGSPGRTEWVERPLEDEVLETCVFSALAELRFAPSAGSTLVDFQLQVAGVSKLRHRL